jgi:hypothetical protein
MQTEPLYFYLTGNWYTGKMPNFFDVSEMESTKILESNYERMKAEILDFYEKDSESLKPNFTPYKYKEEGWRTINLCAVMLQYPEVIKKFPVVHSVVTQIPHMVTAQIAVLKPHTRVKAHFGDSNAIIRNHLGIVVPGKYPDLGFRNGSKEKCWEEGKVLAICIAHRHYVWNNTDHKRIILLVDTINPAYVKKKFYICAGMLAAATLKGITTKFPFTKKTPAFLVRLLHQPITWAYMLILFLQNNMKLDFGTFRRKIKVDL